MSTCPLRENLESLPPPYFGPESMVRSTSPEVSPRAPVPRTPHGPRPRGSRARHRRIPPLSSDPPARSTARPTPPPLLAAMSPSTLLTAFAARARENGPGSSHFLCARSHHHPPTNHHLHVARAGRGLKLLRKWNSERKPPPTMHGSGDAGLVMRRTLGAVCGGWRGGGGGGGPEAQNPRNCRALGGGATRGRRRRPEVLSDSASQRAQKMGVSPETSSPNIKRCVSEETSANSKVGVSRETSSPKIKKQAFRLILPQILIRRPSSTSLFDAD